MECSRWWSECSEREPPDPPFKGPCTPAGVPDGGRRAPAPPPGRIRFGDVIRWLRPPLADLHTGYIPIVPSGRGAWARRMGAELGRGTWAKASSSRRADGVQPVVERAQPGITRRSGRGCQRQRRVPIPAWGAAASYACNAPGKMHHNGQRAEIPCQPRCERNRTRKTRHG